MNAFSPSLAPRPARPGMIRAPRAASGREAARAGGGGLRSPPPLVAHTVNIVAFLKLRSLL